MKDKIRQITDSVSRKWFDAVYGKKWLKFSLIGLVILLNIYGFIFIVFEGVIILSVFIGALILSMHWTYTAEGKIALFAAFVFSLWIFPFLLIIPILIGLYLFYYFLENNRLNRIRKIAAMTPSQLSKVQYEKPKVEIIIRGDRR